MRALLAALAACLLSVPAFAGPIAGYPYASTPYNASDSPVGTQNNATVQFTMANIATYAQSNTTAWNVQAKFGAHGNTIAYADGAINATTSAFSSSSASFTSADVGKNICVDGSGPASANQCGTITGYTSTHAVSVSFTAATSVTNARYMYGNDDGAPLSAAINAAIALNSPYTPVCLYLPPGNYGLFSGPLPTFYFYPGCVEGDGALHTNIILNPNYSGSVFSWSEDWARTNTTISTNDVGPKLSGLEVIGDSTDPNTATAVALYDRDDQVYMIDVTVINVTGACLSIGHELNQVEAYTRESVFINYRCFGAGATATPSVDIDSQGALGGQDATNELAFYNLNIFGSPGAGVNIHNDSVTGERLIRFFGLRIEDSTAGDLLDIGNSADTASVDEIHIFGFEGTNDPSGYYAVRINSASGTVEPYDVTIDGTVGNGRGSGIRVDYGRGLYFNFDQLNTTGTNFTAGANAGGGIFVTGGWGGGERTWTWSVNSAAYSNVAVPLAITCHNAGLC